MQISPKKICGGWQLCICYLRLESIAAQGMAEMIVDLSHAFLLYFIFSLCFFASPLICSSMIHVYIYGKENIYTCIYLLSLPPFAVPVSLIWLQKKDAFKMTSCKVMCWKYQNDNKMVIKKECVSCSMVLCYEQLILIVPLTSICFQEASKSL